MRDVSLRVKLVLAIDATLDFARPERGNDRWHTAEKVVFRLLGFQASIEPLSDLFQSFPERPLRSHRDLVSHQNAKVIDSLPLPIQGEQRADLEIPGGNIDGSGELAPFCKV